MQPLIASDYPEAVSFRPSLVFVATWERVAPQNPNYRGLVNTFQVVVASDGTWTFVRFSYGDIQWGGTNTLIGISAGDGINFYTHFASLSSSVLLLDSTAITYRIDGKHICGQFSTVMSEAQNYGKYSLSGFTTTPPTVTTPPPIECSTEGEILPYFRINETSAGRHLAFEGTFEICIRGLYGSVCDIGWNQAAAQTLCSQFGSRFIKYSKLITYKTHGFKD